MEALMDMLSVLQVPAQAWLQGLQQGLQQLQLVTRDLQLVAAAAADAEGNPEAHLQLEVYTKSTIPGQQAILGSLAAPATSLYLCNGRTLTL